MKKLLPVALSMAAAVGGFLPSRGESPAPPFVTSPQTLYQPTSSEAGKGATAEWRLANEAVSATSEFSPLSTADTRKAPLKAAELPTLDGTWIMRYEPLLKTSGRGGNAVTLRTVEGTDSVYIDNFWRTGTHLYGKIDRSRGVVCIPYQYITSHASYGKLNVATVDHASGRPLTTESIEFTPQADGSLYSPDWWALVVTTGDNRGEATDAYYNTSWMKGNTTMSNADIDSVVSSYPVIVEQTGPNILSVQNFRNYGLTVDIRLNSDKSAVIPQQVGYEASPTSQYLTVGSVKLDDKKNPTSWLPTIEIPAPENPRTLVWTDWTMILGKSYWTGFNGTTTLEVPFDISYPPSLEGKDFRGEGTSASPYLISTPQDMLLLAEKAAAMPAGSEGAPTRMWEGKTFRMTADIDMANYRMTAVSTDMTRSFAATFDGDSHTLKNFSISENGVEFASLFGYIDTLGTVKNLNIDNAAISSASIVPAVIASHNEGKILFCNVTNSTVNTSNRGAGGLAGLSAYMEGCSISNSTVRAGEGFVGGLVAQLTGPLTNCSATMTNVVAEPELYQGSPVGGLVGAANQFAIKDCLFQGEIASAGSGYTNMGGLTGSISKGSISNSMATAVMSPLPYANQVTGGLSGIGFGTYTDCLSASWIRSHASPFTGAFTGLTQYLNGETGVTTANYVNCLSLSMVDAALEDGYDPALDRELFGSFDQKNPPTSTNCHFNKQISDFGSDKGMTTAQLIASSGIEGYDTSVWTFGGNLYPRLKKWADTPAGTLASAALDLPARCSYERATKGGSIATAGQAAFRFLVKGQLTETGHFGRISGSQLLLNDNLDFGTDTLVVVNGKAMLPMPIQLLPIPCEGDGTAASPYLVKTKNDLIALGRMTSTFGISFADMQFRMTNDIDMEYTDEFRGLGYDPSNTSSNVFRSTFDGNGFTISRMRIGDLVWKVRPEDDPEGLGTVDTDNSRATWIGFVGRLGATGKVCNLTIAADCRFEAFASAGAIAGWNYGTIENCTNFASIEGQSSWIGGIAGQTLAGSRIVGCYNAGNISTGYRNAGGIVSVNTQGMVENCVNVGDVSAKEGYQRKGKNNIKFAGGITGGINGGRVQNCLNSGNISALEGNAGGIAGSAPKAATSSAYGSDLIGCLSYGTVECGLITTTGGLVGESATEGRVENSYFDCQTAPFGAFGNSPKEGATGLTVAELISGTLPQGLSETLWSAEKGRYPVMKSFEKYQKMMDASRVYVDFPADENALDMSSAARLSSYEGTTWKLTSARSFSIADGMLNVPVELKDIETDTVAGSLGDYTKRISVRAIPQIPLQGKGTADSPYLITSPADWNTISDFMNRTVNSYTGKFFQVAADIDFAEGEMKGLGSDVVPFEATLDGNGKTISGFVFTATAAPAGPVNTLGASGIIRNLTLNGTVTTTATVTKSYLGGFAGRQLGTIEDCVNLSTVSSPKGYVGGFAGIGGQGSRFVRCVNKGELQVFGNFGGIVGEGGYQALYEDCVNEGLLNDQGASSSYANYVAGIAGRSLEADFIRCINRGSLKLKEPSKTYGVAGIIGYCDGKKGNTPFLLDSCINEVAIEAGGDVAGMTASAASVVGGAMMTVKNCVNKADIKSLSSGSYYTGGISARYKPGSTYRNCVNEGNVWSEKLTGTGGIVGSVSGVPTEAFPVVLDSCLNKGNVHAGGGMGGGVIGSVNKFTVVSNTGNTGAVEGTHGIGGVAGALYGADGEVINCWNTGDVTTSSNRTGGIVGYANNGGLQSKISGCWNAGNVATTSTKPGTVNTVSDPSGYAIGGIAGLSPSAISGCVNFGSVTGVSQVGGILGSPVKDRTSIADCVNIGKIVAPTDTAGNIVGVNLANGKIWTAKNSIAGCYYLKTDSVYANDGDHAEALGLAEMTSHDFGEKLYSADAYCFPIPAAFSTQEAALLWSVAVVPQGTDVYPVVTGPFKVGAPECVEWSSDPAIVVFSGNDTDFSADFTGTLTLIATAGEWTKEFTLDADGLRNAVEAIESTDVTERRFFTLGGLEVKTPQPGEVYVMRTLFNDGRAVSVKVIYRK